DLGPAAFAWVDALARARQGWWQILPLGPTGYGDSPYQCFSAFAGNPILISPELLARDGLLQPGDLDGAGLPGGRIDYSAAIRLKAGRAERASARSRGGAAPKLREPFEDFCARKEEWLDDFALFLAIKEANGGVSWYEWPRPLALREPEALARAREDYGVRVGLHQFRQFLFYRQWDAVKAYANDRGIRLIGDVPIFIA